MQKLFRVVSSLLFWIVSSISGVTVGYIIRIFSDYEVTKNNLGEGIVRYEVITDACIILGTALLFGLTAYKVGYFSLYSTTVNVQNKNTNRERGGLGIVSQRRHVVKHGGIGVLGMFISLLITGCPACSVTLATYVGLSGFFSIFPFFGYEIRVVGLCITFFALYITWRDLEVCSIKK